MAFKGSSVLLKKGTASTGTTIGGMRTTGLSINSESVDITTADNANRWRELLPEAGIKNMSITMSGVLSSVAAHQTMMQDMIAQTIDQYGLIMDDFGYFDGAFMISSVEANGEYNGEETYSLTLESGGDIAFTTGAPA